MINFQKLLKTLAESLLENKITEFVTSGWFDFPKVFKQEHTNKKKYS